jgi:membrane protein YdbS with pleckstrin-like domain
MTPERLVADGKEHTLDPDSIMVDRLSGGVGIALLSAILLVAVLLAAFLGPFNLLGGLALVVGWVFLTAGLVAFVLWWPAVRFRRTAYQVSDHGIRIRRGVIWRSISSVPRSRVQHTDVAQGPIERAYDLATLIIYTAGTHEASVSLGGLKHETALLIRDHLIAGGESDAV